MRLESQIENEITLRIKATGGWTMLDLLEKFPNNKEEVRAYLLKRSGIDDEEVYVKRSILRAKKQKMYEVFDKDPEELVEEKLINDDNGQASV